MKRLLYVCGGVVAAALVWWFLKLVFAGTIILQPTLDIGSFSIHFYGFFLGLAILAGYFIVRSNGWRYGLSHAEIDKLVFWSIISSVIGARIYFVIFDWKYFASHSGEIIKFWNGGLSIYGAIFAGILFLLRWSRGKIYSIRQLLDLTSLGFPLAHAIGRLGNLFNYEAYGVPTNLPWKMYVPIDSRTIQSEAFYHPAFLYEGAANLILFVLLMALRGKVKPGYLAATYLMSYAAIRFSTEFVRMDSVMIGLFKVDQVVSGLIFISVLVWVIWDKARAKQ